jgi:hypothetical protein
LVAIEFNSVEISSFARIKAGVEELHPASVRIAALNCSLRGGDVTGREFDDSKKDRLAQGA